MKTILFVSPDCTFTGAPIYLLNYIKYLKQHSEYKIIFIFKNQNKRIELLNEFENQGDVYYWEDILTLCMNRNSSLNYLYKKIFQKNNFLKSLIFRLSFRFFLQKENIKLIVSNTATVEKSLLLCLKNILSVPIITIVHEGKKLLAHFNEDGTVDRNFSMADSLICVSEQLKATLQSTFSINKEIHILPGTFKAEKHYKTDKSLLQEYDIPANAKIILSCGWLSWHKGADFFVQTAIEVLNSNPNVHFCWLGSPTKDDAHILTQFNYDIQMAGIERNVHHIPSSSTPLAYFNLADIFLMLSRDESFSLVTVEACSLHKPVLCFENSGGPCEILDYNLDLIIPYGNIKELSRQIITLLENEKKRETIGNLLFDKVSNNYIIEKTGPKFLEILNNLIK